MIGAGGIIVATSIPPKLSRMDGSGAVPAITENLTVSGIDLLPFLRDAGNFTTLSGTGSIEMTGINGHGKSQREIIGSLDGKGMIHVCLLYTSRAREPGEIGRAHV